MRLYNLMSRIRFLSILIPTIVCGVVAQAAPVQTAHVEAELVAEHASIQTGVPFTVGLRLKLDEHWHVYWLNPGDSGMAPSIEWSLPDGFTVSEIQWPTPHRIPTPPFMTYGYEGEVLLMAEISPPAGLPPGTQVELGAHSNWLVCETVCMPGEVVLSLQLPVEAGPPRTNESWAALFAATRQQLPADRSEAWPAEFAVHGPDYVVEVSLPAESAVTDSDIYFFPLDELVIEPSVAQRAQIENGKLTLHIARSEVNTESPGTLRGVLSVPGGFGAELVDRSVYIEAAPGSSSSIAPGESSTSFLFTAGLGFLGGLILNLMPCVFPVLGIKILGFVHQAGADRGKVKLHGLVFTAGVLLSFWSLAGVLAVLRAGGEQLGWGFQLQSPVFVFALTVFLLIFALNLTGLFEIGLSATAVGGSLQMQSGLSGSFFSGVLATVVATPCAPFLAPALGAAMTQPPLESFALFTVIALGLATPYLVLSAFPDLVKLLPRPGGWMETFKQLMAFPLYATVGFLVWVLAGQVSEGAFLNILFALVLVAMAGWAYGRWTQQGGSRGRKTAGCVFAALLLTAGLTLGVPIQKPSEIVWREWSPETVATLRADGKTIYVDFTARWCATCKVNKAVVFSSKEVRDAFVDLDIVPLKADWTNRNPAITQALALFGRSAVPFNLIYTPGRPEPVLLPEVLTPRIVLDALAGLDPVKRADTE